MVGIHEQFGVGEFDFGYVEFVHQMSVDKGSGRPTVDKHFEGERGVTGYRDSCV